MKLKLVLLEIIGCFAVLFSCSSSSSDPSPTYTYSLSLIMTRLPQSGVDPFRVTVTLLQNGSAYSGQTLSLTVPKGTVSAVTDNGDGTYDFTVTPAATGTYPVTVTFNDQSLTRKAVVLDSNLTGSGQPMAIPGDYVNTEGYEDGVTISPDGEYLFVQYGPFYFAGIANFLTICSSGSYSIGYDLNTCDGRTNSFFVFDIKGPYSAPYRPGFPSGAFSAGKLRHIPGLVVSGLANGIVGFPTVIYGFKKQSDGTFAEPFKVAFDDERAIQGPFGISTVPNGDGTAKFAIAYNNNLNNLGDDFPDIYNGTLTFGQDFNLGGVSYTGDAYASITPTISPVSFSSHAGTQGNPHLYANTSGTITSIWTDDESASHDMSVYRLTSGTFPSGTWTLDTLPSAISTAAEEDQPFFTGDKLIFSRDGNVVYHTYQSTNGACSSGFTHNDCWGPEVVLIGANGNTTTGEIFAVGEPTVATVGSKKYLYFVYVEARSLSSGVIDWNTDAAFVEIP